MEIDNKYIKKSNKNRSVKVLTFVKLLFIISFTLMISSCKKETSESITVSTLQQIINVSELSTLTTVYNGIAEVRDEKKTKILTIMYLIMLLLTQVSILMKWLLQVMRKQKHLL